MGLFPIYALFEPIPGVGSILTIWEPFIREGGLRSKISCVENFENFDDSFLTRIFTHVSSSEKGVRGLCVVSLCDIFVFFCCCQA